MTIRAPACVAVTLLATFALELRAEGAETIRVAVATVRAPRWAHPNTLAAGIRHGITAAGVRAMSAEDASGADFLVNVNLTRKEKRYVATVELIRASDASVVEQFEERYARGKASRKVGHAIGLRLGESARALAVAAPTAVEQPPPVAPRVETEVAKTGVAKIEVAKLEPQPEVEAQLKIEAQPKLEAQLNGAAPLLLVRRTADRPPSIDGRLDEEAWSIAAADLFTQRQPDEGDPASERTELRATYDEEALYFAIRCHDRTPDAIVERLTRRDRETEADKISIDLSPRNDGQSGYHFSVNVAGVRVDGVRYNDTELNLEWDGLWVAATSRDASGWTAELRIPLATVHYDASSPRIGLQVRRFLQRRQEIAEWSHTPSTASGEVTHYGELEGVVDVEPAPPLYVVPYLSGQLTGRSDHDVGNGIDRDLRVGVDATVGLATDLTLSLTINPDFGQVEADQVVFNLTTFETLLPEKRPFFLDGMSIFFTPFQETALATPFQQLYSRRIGGPPPGPDAPLAEPLDEGKIWGAAKMVGSLAPGLTVGLLSALTADREAMVQLAGDRIEPRLVDPMASYNALRLKQDFGAASSVGIMLTGVTRLEEPGAAAPEPGDLCPDGNAPGIDQRCTRDAYTAGLDLRIFTGDGTWGGTAQIIGSFLHGGPTQLLPDGTRLDDSTLGWGVIANVGKYGGEHWLYELLYIGASPTFELNDLGALPQGNLHRLHPVLTYRDTEPGGLLQNWQVQANSGIFESWDGVPLRRAFELTSLLRFRNFWELYFEATAFLEHQDNRELRDGARLERGPAAWFYGSLTSDSRNPVVVTAAAGVDLVSGVEEDFSIPIVEASATISVRPIPALEIDLIGNMYTAFGEPRWVTTTEGDELRQYLIADLDAESFDVTLRATYAFTRDLSLQAYAQFFTATGRFGRAYAATGRGPHPVLHRDDFQPAELAEDFDFREAAFNASVLARWEFVEGATFTVFYGRSQIQAPSSAREGLFDYRRLTGGPATDVAIAKFTFLLDVSR